MKIRDAGPEDFELLAELGARTFRDSFGPQNRTEDIDAYVAAHFASDTMRAWLKQYAVASGCDETHLDSGAWRKDANRFFQREGV